VADALTVAQWARERLQNSERIAASRTGADRDGWLEDVAYWREIVRQLTALDQASAALDELAAPDPEKPLAERIRDEFHDFQMVIHHCSVIYGYVTEGRISKPNTLPEVVMAEADDRERERTDKAITEATTELKAALNHAQRALAQARQDLAEMSISDAEARVARYRAREKERPRG
jgi:hypothetical protein